MICIKWCECHVSYIDSQDNKSFWSTWHWNQQSLKWLNDVLKVFDVSIDRGNADISSKFNNTYERFLVFTLKKWPFWCWRLGWNWKGLWHERCEKWLGTGQWVWKIVLVLKSQGSPHWSVSGLDPELLSIASFWESCGGKRWRPWDLSPVFWLLHLEFWLISSWPCISLKILANLIPNVTHSIWHFCKDVILLKLRVDLWFQKLKL